MTIQPYFADEQLTVYAGDCRDALKAMPDRSVQCVVTSPPYFGLRKYGDDAREIGQEPTPAEYVAAIVEVFREVKRVLRDDGTCWINIGDSFGRGTRPLWHGDSRRGAKDREAWADGRYGNGVELPEKQLLGIPWRVAFALQDDGWILRSDIIWAKSNCMPESVRDRPTRSHEYVFMFAKQARYFYDAAAVAEAATNGERFHGGYDKPGIIRPTAQQNGREASSENTTTTRNRRSVWTISTQPYSGAHYATMPEALIEPCILAGSAAQACEVCGAPWRRVVERHPALADDGKTCLKCGKNHGRPKIQTEYTEHRAGALTVEQFVCVDVTTTGWAPTCTCPNAGAGRCVVLDPFGGSGTTARVALRLQRRAVLIELNPTYIDEHIMKRTNGVQVEMAL